MRILVTGGAGFIGSNLVRRLVSNPDVEGVDILDDLSSGTRRNLDGLAARLIEGSILDRDLVRDLVGSADRVVHLAARPSVPRSIADPETSHRVNVQGTFEVLEAARLAGGRPVVFASSSSVYGANTTLPKRAEDWCRPLSPYAASKLAGEAMTLAWQVSYGMPTWSFRFFNVYGPHQLGGHAYAAVVPAFLEAVEAGRPLPVNGDGRQTRDFTFVASVAEVLALAAVGGSGHPAPVNLAFGTRTSLLDLIAEVGAVTGREVPVEHRPARVGDVRDSQADAGQIGELFPSVVPVPLGEGLAITWGWWTNASRPRD